MWSLQDAVLSPKSMCQCTGRGQHVLTGSVNVQNGVENRSHFSGMPLFLEHASFRLLLLKMVDGRGGGGGGIATWCSTVQFYSKQQAGSQPLWPGCHDNCEPLLLLPWLPLLSAEPWCRLPVPAGSACQWRAKQEPPPHTHTPQARAQLLLSALGVADSGPNSGTSAALSLSGTGVVEGVGAEEVLLVMLVVVVRSRYQYGQWKRHGHLHNKAINGVLNSSHTINI